MAFIEKWLSSITRRFDNKVAAQIIRYDQMARKRRQYSGSICTLHRECDID